ncbi:rho GTPase-activating protein 20-like [Spea bombifrons]|uniref:rho GTPase-activating protein 20-like n=1 Tax=Spea bombifrons TaxID=233779 RepID=UPI00234C00C7|nr:rho GTPase-activating protein 20-like [Spea bombifrons]
MKMTLQQASLQKAPSRDLGSWIQEGGKKMKASVQRRRSTSAITKALSKSKLHSREITLFPANSANGLLLGAFCSPSNMFIMKERVQLTSGWQIQERHLFLFTDTLIIAKSKSSSSLKLKKQVHLNDMWTTSCISEISERNLSTDNSFVIGWPTTNYIVTFSSPETKEKWLSTLCWHINEVKKNEHGKSVPISVLYLDADDLTSSTTINVCNMDTADKVIKMASQQLGIPGRPSDYHLWVLNGKDEPPYSLFGHEHPYSIVMNCLQEYFKLPSGSNNNLFVDKSTETVIAEQLQRERQCRFILRLKPQVPLYTRGESVQKHSRRKKSLIDWALRRSGSTTLSSPASQSPTTPRKLFGLSLSSVCLNGNLPKPIMDMLMVLYEEGPNTKGIFRRSANAKTCKELKEKLISGDEVQINRESVFVAASVIMDFLRNIPDSILSSDMYGLWIEVTEMEEHEYKVEVIKRLLKQLPEANAVLLQHLFAVLHHIKENSEENQMTAFNLALCIAPNILWLPTACDPEEETKSTKKVALLVQFLIENYHLIFGQDVESLFRKPDKEHSTSADDLSGISLIHGQDSSDELEFAASDLDKSDPNLLKDMDEMFDESLLLDDREDWDLFSEIAACYQSKTRMDTLGCLDKDPFNCINSACCLSPSRDRCSSEPTVCLSSRIPVQDHEPVARQSSCDATIMHNHIDYINHLKQLQMETQKLIDEELSTTINKHMLWRSPQSRTRLKNKSPHKLTPSSRSSFSSLSSTSTSPSASSLSSLDSTFSYCSESSVFTPNDVTSLPFMFGTSARLHTLSPEISQRKLKEWHAPLSMLFTSDLDLGEAPVKVEDKVISEDNIQKNNKDNKCFAKKMDFDFSSSVEAKATTGLFIDSKCEENYVQANVSSDNSHCVHRETSTEHTEISKQESSNDDNLKKTKVTFFMSPNIIPVKNMDDSDENTDSNGSHCQSTRLNIPQTVFYGQNAPLVLHSVSRKQHLEMEKPLWQTQLKHVKSTSTTNVMLPDNTKPVESCQMSGIYNETVKEEQIIEHNTEERIEEPTLNKSHSKSITSFTQTIRIVLPSSVRNTMRGYFKHTESKSNSTSQVETGLEYLLHKAPEDCNQPTTNSSIDTKEQSSVQVEQSFV